MIKVVTKGDHTGAFGARFLEIYIINNTSYTISRAIFVCGCIQKELDLTQNPILVNLTSEETKILYSMNVCSLVVYDGEGRQRTCTGSITFPAKNGVI